MDLQDEVFRTTEQVVSWLAGKGLQVRPQTLINLRHTGGGPAFHRFGNRVVYAEKDLLSWLQHRLGKPLNSTSDIQAGVKRERRTQASCDSVAVVGQTSGAATQRATVGTRPQLKRSP